MRRGAAAAAAVVVVVAGAMTLTCTMVVAWGAMDLEQSREGREKLG